MVDVGSETGAVPFEVVEVDLFRSFWYRAMRLARCLESPKKVLKKVSKVLNLVLFKIIFHFGPYSIAF